MIHVECDGRFWASEMRWLGPEERLVLAFTESLVKHEQMGIDKMQSGRLVVVSNKRRDLPVLEKTQSEASSISYNNFLNLILKLRGILPNEQ